MQQDEQLQAFVKEIITGMGEMFENAREETLEMFKNAREETLEMFKNAREETLEMFRNARQETQILIGESENRTRVLLEHQDQKISLLAEQVVSLNQKVTGMDERLGRVEEDVKVIKAVVSTHSRDIQQLKRAE